MSEQAVVLIPSFTGLRLVRSGQSTRDVPPVLIPSFTGLRLVSTISKIEAANRRLNPFFYRSSVGRLRKHLSINDVMVLIPSFTGLRLVGLGIEKRQCIGLNPFFYRSSVGLKTSYVIAKAECLNPFFYRSSVGPNDGEYPILDGRLNPFFYRSSVGPNRPPNGRRCTPS